ncbi:hypothetical protein S40293_10299 [Stachybotrys chartarum IBT 40293]|nr:hypothetical protein S40293_10299 [Stachybotrys chartarum IBT 40293]
MENKIRDQCIFTA